MQCPQCQAENPAGMKFCGQCAAPLVAVCPSCGTSNPAENRFCGQCARPLSKPAQRRLPSPEAYTPKHLAERILTSKVALEGERKQVTVLFADMKGSMELLADRDPEEAGKLLDPVLEHMMEAVHRYEGTVNQVMGDGIMALFGAPVAHEDHALRACYAALRMQTEVSHHGDQLQRSHGLPVQIRVGLNSGEVVVRTIGSDLRMDYTAVGQTTHLAARMEQIAKPATTLLTAHTLRLAEGRIHVRPLGPLAVKGLDAPVEVYELTGAAPARSRLEAAAARGLTRFVGRTAEMDQLIRSLEQARAGRGQVFAVMGDAGVGKSRFFYEFTRSHHAQDCLVLESASVSYGKATAYLPVVDLLKRYCRIEDRDDTRAVREKVTGKLLTLDRALEDSLPAVLALLDALPDDNPFLGLDPPKRRQQTLGALKRLFLRESQVEPLVLVAEDLHWVDAETHALLDSLVESLPTARVLLLVNYRPECQHGWGGKPYYSQLRLDPLTAESAEELLRTLLGPDPALAPLKRRLIKRTEGNPFFLEESVRTLVETQALAGEPGSHRLAKPLPAIQVPATVQALLAARIDRLPPEEKSLLQSAAVIGKDVPFALLREITDETGDVLRRGLDRLQTAEFLYETSLFPDLEYTFKHALTHEVAYGSLLQERRRILHARIVQAIEQLYPDRLAEHVERLAHSALRAEAWEKAFPYLRQAGAKAFSRSAYREAVAWFEQALVALQHLPESRETLEQAIDLHFDLRNSLLPLGEHARYVEHLRAADTIARSLGDQYRLGWISAYMTAYLYLMGEDRALESGERALEIAESLGDLRLQVSTNTWVGQVHYHRGDYRRAVTFFKMNLERLVGDLVQERLGLPQLPSVHSRTCLVWCLAELGEFGEAIPYAEEGLRIAEAADHPLSLTVAFAGLGALYLRQGDLQRAISRLERGLELNRSSHVPLWFPRLASALGRAYALAGRTSAAIPLLEQAIERAAAMKLMGGHSLLVTLLSEAYLLADRVGEALELARRALDLAREHRERGYEAWVLRLLAEIALASHPCDLDRARVYCLEAMALAKQLEMRPLVAHTHLAFARTAARSGRPADAASHLTAAASLFRHLEMRRGVTEAEAELERLA